ncbi:MAG: LytTR family DNA-binding domain-containing protein [Lutispora sp.]
MLNFIICDDTHAQSIRDVVEPIIVELNLGKIVIFETKPDKVLDYINNNTNTSVYFIDIELDTTINGIDIARLIRDKDDSSYIVFITAHQEFAFLTYKYRLQVIDYIVKPIRQEDIRDCLQEIHKSEEVKKIQRGLKNQENYILEVKSGWKKYRIDIRDIIYVEVTRNRIVIHTERGQTSFLATLKEIRDRLCCMDADSFMVCHKSYLVNIKKIKLLDKTELIMSNGERCPISRSYKRGIIDALDS